ncbi:MAG: hypothetical protein RR721_08690 [Aeromonas sp.]
MPISDGFSPAREALQPSPRQHQGGPQQIILAEAPRQQPGIQPGKLHAH